MQVPVEFTRRLVQLERLVQRQQESLDALAGRRPRSQNTRWVHLAKTIKVGGSYPASGSNTFGLQFIDREFTPSEGTQSITDHSRSATSQGVGRTLDGSFLAEGTVCLAIPAPPASGTTAKGRWQILPLATSAALIYLGQADGDLVQDTDGPVTRYVGAAETPEGSTDTVINKWPTIADGDWVIYGLIDGYFYVLAPSGGSSTPSGIPFVNNSGEAVPPYAAMWNANNGILVSGGTAYVDIGKPDTTFDVHWLVNGSSTIPYTAPDTNKGTGFWRLEQSGPVAVDAQWAGLIQAGDRLGVSPGSWYLQKNRPGFIALGPTRTQDGVLVVDCRQRTVETVFGKSYTDATQNAAGTTTIELEIWHRTATGNLIVSGWDHITAYLLFLNKNEQVLRGTWGRADYHTDYWEADFACDKDNRDTAQQAQGQDQLAPAQAAGAGGGQQLIQQIQQGIV